jgi:hypothetical protein
VAGEEWSEEIVVFDDRYYTVSLPMADYLNPSEIHLWESADGLEWSLVELPKMYEADLNVTRLVGGGQGLVLAVSADREYFWLTDDGRDWAEMSLPRSTSLSIYELIGTDFGWIAPGTTTFALSQDGVTWQDIELPPVPLSDGSTPVHYFNGTFLVGSGVTWTAQLPDDPG